MFQANRKRRKLSEKGVISNGFRKVKCRRPIVFKASVLCTPTNTQRILSARVPEIELSCSFQIIWCQLPEPIEHEVIIQMALKTDGPSTKSQKWLNNITAIMTPIHNGKPQPGPANPWLMIILNYR